MADSVVFCPQCGLKVLEHKFQHKKKKLKPILITIFSVLSIFCLTLAFLYLHDSGVFDSSETKLKESYEVREAISMYIDKFESTSKAAIGEKIIFNLINSNKGNPNFGLDYVISDALDGDGYLLDNIIKILSNYSEAVKTDESNALLKTYRNIKTILSESSPIKKIRANPTDYTGQTISVIGFCGSNYIDKKTLFLENNRDTFAKDSYRLELYYGSQDDKEKWEDYSGEGIIFAKGILKAYYDSPDKYYMVVDEMFLFDDLPNYDWSQWNKD